MGRTIIQPIGPLYGEAVNNTVFGRPNGSIYVPDTNRVTMNIKTGFEYVFKDGNNFKLCNSSKQVTGDALKIYADSQDNAAFIRLGLYVDDECTTLLTGGGQSAYIDYTAGSFNKTLFGLFTKSAITLTDETTYYLRATLMASTGVAVANSDIIEVVGLA